MPQDRREGKYKKEDGNICNANLMLQAKKESPQPLKIKGWGLFISYSHSVESGHNPKKAANNGGVDIKTFIPKYCGMSNINNHSVVTVIQYLNVKILFPGDNEAVSWKELLDKPDFVKAIQGTNIFVAPHHGRESGYSSELFQYIKPELTIISDGLASKTSITNKYTQHSTGWKVYRRSEGYSTSYERKCLTT